MTEKQIEYEFQFHKGTIKTAVIADIISYQNISIP